MAKDRFQKSNLAKAASQNEGQPLQYLINNTYGPVMARSDGMH